MKVILLHFHNIFSTLFKIYLLRRTTSYVPDDPPIAEQQHDFVICESPEGTTDECGNDGNGSSIEDQKMQSGSDRYLISNISKVITKKM